MDQHFSRRLAWRRAENRLAVAEAERRGASHELLDLTESNPTVVGLDDSETSAALCEVFARAARGSYAPEPRGLRLAREAIARAYEAAGQPVDADRLLLTTSSSESYSFLWKLLCDPGDTVLIPEPSYPLFDYLAGLDGVATLSYDLTHDGTRFGRWQLDLSSIDDALARARAAVAGLVVVSPNNPTGSALDAGDLDALDERAASGGFALLADEVFADYLQDPATPAIRCVAARPTRALTFSLGGLSKSCGLPQLKLGWIAVGGPAPAAQEALARLELIADTYLSVSTPVQRALPELLDLGRARRAKIAVRIARNRERLLQLAGPDSALSVLRSEGGWSAIVRLPAILTDEEWALRLLERDGVLVQPGYFFDLRSATYVVVSLLCQPAVFDEAMSRLAGRVADSLH